MISGQPNPLGWTTGGPEVRCGPAPPSMCRPRGYRDLMKKKALSRFRDSENQRPKGTPLWISEVTLDIGPDCLYFHGCLAMAL